MIRTWTGDALRRTGCYTTCTAEMALTTFWNADIIISCQASAIARNTGIVLSKSKFLIWTHSALAIWGTRTFFTWMMAFQTSRRGSIVIKSWITLTGPGCAVENPLICYKIALNALGLFRTGTLIAGVIACQTYKRAGIVESRITGTSSLHEWVQIFSISRHRKTVYNCVFLAS